MTAEVPEARRLLNCSVREKDYALLTARAEANNSSRAHELQRMVDEAFGRQTPGSGLEKATTEVFSLGRVLTFLATAGDFDLRAVEAEASAIRRARRTRKGLTKP